MTIGLRRASSRVAAIVLLLISQVAFSSGDQDEADLRSVMELLMNQRQIDGTWEGKARPYDIKITLSVDLTYDLEVKRGPFGRHQEGIWVFVDTTMDKGLLVLDPGVRSPKPTTHEVTFMEDDKICVEVKSIVKDCIVLERKI